MSTRERCGLSSDTDAHDWKDWDLKQKNLQTPTSELSAQKSTALALYTDTTTNKKEKQKAKIYVQIKRQQGQQITH